MVLVIEAEEVMSDGFGTFHISESSVDKMGLSSLLDFEDGPHKSLDHGFVVYKALPDLRMTFLLPVHYRF